MLKTSTVALTFPATAPQLAWIAPMLLAEGLTLTHLEPVTLLVTVTAARVPVGGDVGAWLLAALHRVVPNGKVRTVRRQPPHAE